jgi:UDP-N-acetylglucosamine--N-acetylmuramyl-(pentapeptide) pyrophosphoryl-undecaprenol N-acetylglucosamine transferase
MIGYYIHHSGEGHLARAISIATQLRHSVTALTSAQLRQPHPFHSVVPLPRDDTAPSVDDPTAGGALHWVPRHDRGLRQRMRLIADWIDQKRPSAVVVDVSVEVATLVRLLGVPVIVVAMPGQRTDAPHELVYRLADHIIACWPGGLYRPLWLRPHHDKVSYVGGISRFDGRDRDTGARHELQIVVLGGAGSSQVDLAKVHDCATQMPQYRWRPVGVSTETWVPDPWPYLCAADIVVAHAGEGSIADLAAAARPALIIAQRRPFDEQTTTATIVGDNGLAVIHPQWPTSADWPELLRDVHRIDVRRWRQWRTRGAAQRAASVIEHVVDNIRGVSRTS